MNASNATTDERTITVESHFSRPKAGTARSTGASSGLFPYNPSRRLPETQMALALERCVAWIVRIAAWLVLPVSFLLFLQWPLRDLVHAGSREANDLAQILFALYVSVALTAATRENAHLAADVLARRYPARTRERMWRAACLTIAIPASAYVLWSGASAAWL